MKNNYYPQVADIIKAKEVIGEQVSHTPLLHNHRLSKLYNSNIFLKREDLQIVRSYKIRGAINKIKSITQQERDNGIVCASAGNHAQGVAFACNNLGIKGYIYMPTTTPKQKIEQVKMFGNGNVKIVLIGDTFDEANQKAIEFANKENKKFIHPFDDPKTIEGQGTIGIDIIEQCKSKPDFIFIPIGGGGLASGVGAYIKQVSPSTKIIGVEPLGAAGMKHSMEMGKVTPLEKVDKFVDGAAVSTVGAKTFNICQQVVDEIITVPEGAVCTTILELYNKDAIVVEPAGALAITALRFFNGSLDNKNVVCIVSGSNNDITRMEEIREKSLLYEELKHYFIIRFAQRSGALHTFIKDILGPNDDITHFAYTKKNNKEQGPALIGIELSNKNDFNSLIQNMDAKNVAYEYLNTNQNLFEILV